MLPSVLVNYIICTIASATQLSTSLTDSDESDFLLINLSSSSLNEDQLGVWTEVDIDPDVIICELKGFLIPSPEASDYDMSSILAFNVTSATGLEYKLIENTICSRIRVVPLSESDLLFLCPECFQINTRIQRTPIGKLFVTSTQFITSNTELFMSHLDYNIPSTFNATCYYSYNGCNIPGK